MASVRVGNGQAPFRLPNRGAVETKRSRDGRGFEGSPSRWLERHQEENLSFGEAPYFDISPNQFSNLVVDQDLEFRG